MKRLTASIAAFLFTALAHAAPQDVSVLLEKIRDDHEVPALTAAVMDEGKLVAIGATGNRSVAVSVTDCRRRNSRRCNRKASTAMTLTRRWCGSRR